jgi:hypothetical protein
VIDDFTKLSRKAESEYWTARPENRSKGWVKRIKLEATATLGRGATNTITLFFRQWLFWIELDRVLA